MLEARFEVARKTLHFGVRLLNNHETLRKIGKAPIDFTIDSYLTVLK